MLWRKSVSQSLQAKYGVRRVLGRTGEREREWLEIMGSMGALGAGEGVKNYLGGRMTRH